MKMDETLRNLVLVHKIGRKNKFSVAVLLASTAAVTVAISNKPPYLAASNTEEARGADGKEGVYFYKSDGDPITRPTVKMGRWPPLEIGCSGCVLPIACSSDSKCPASRKCCFDPCRQRHVCRLPSPL
ncbi:antimicrobial peptide type 2 precursor IIb [Penaeus vannamei]|uniref:Antimicrobial peptide type 2 IIb n=1 Tax=Penaeus vannamei TaxID=6689 RepID=A0A3R7M7N3_PENVA|nr:antimicrobial peptide type 2 precursor IIb [Penaeus vannamei]